MSDRDTITLPREVAQFMLQHLEWWSDDEPQEKEAITALRTALAAEQPKPSEDIEALRRDAFRKGFYAGFAATGEGWNGEYPFQDKNRPIAGDPSVEAAIDAAMEGKR